MSNGIFLLGAAMMDRTLAAESIEHGVLKIPFCEPLKTLGVYALSVQPSAASHSTCALIMGWFTQQAEVNVI